MVDACQLRSEAETIRKYGAYGFVTIITGSKFYCAIPFCGAVLFPPAALEELNKGYQHLPAGFKDYFTQHEVQHEVERTGRLALSRSGGFWRSRTSVSRARRDSTTVSSSGADADMFPQYQYHISPSIAPPLTLQVDSRYSPLRSRLADWENRGLLLRWAGALTNMEAVKNITKTELDSFIGR